MTAGCSEPYRDWTDDLSWSPDGRHGALLIGHDLYLTDQRGGLTSRLASDVYRAAWLPDSQRLILARIREVTTFTEITEALGAERAAAIARDAERLFQNTFRSDGSVNPDADLDLMLNGDTGRAVAIYLREHHGETLRNALGDDSDVIASARATVYTLVAARIADQRIEVLSTLGAALTPIKSIRPSDDGRAVAFVTHGAGMFADNIVRLYVASVERPATPVLIATGTNEFPDWTRDGRSLLYLTASAADINIGALGCLVQREVVDDQGQIVSRPPGDFCLVHVVFHDAGKVRALPDGRVLFAAVDTRFPQPARALSQVERVFVFDPLHPDSTPPLWPAAIGDAGLGFYDLSPDRTTLLYGTATGDIWRLTVASGDREELPLGLHREEYVRRDLPLALWSGPDAIVYSRYVNDELRLIRRRAESETVLNSAWPRPADSTAR